MSVVVPDEILTITPMTEAEMRQEIAVMLFQGEKLTLALTDTSPIQYLYLTP